MTDLIGYLATLVHAGARSVELRESELGEFAKGLVALKNERLVTDLDEIKDSIRRGDAMFMGVPVVVSPPSGLVFERKYMTVDEAVRRYVPK